jgi:hypothetical protein
LPLGGLLQPVSKASAFTLAYPSLRLSLYCRWHFTLFCSAYLTLNTHLKPSQCCYGKGHPPIMACSKKGSIVEAASPSSPRSLTWSFAGFHSTSVCACSPHPWTFLHDVFCKNSPVPPTSLS